MTTAHLTAPIATTQRVARPTFLGVLRGELYKLTHTRSYLIMFLLALGPTLLLFAGLTATPSAKTRLLEAPDRFFLQAMSAALSVDRIFLGFFVIAATALLIGQEYQQGTIRVVLGRGVGRMQLLSAKLVAMAITAVVTFAVAVALDLVLTVLNQLILVGSLAHLTALPGDFWHTAGIYAVTVLISLGASIAMAAGVSIVARSIVGAVFGSVIYFPADNIATIVLVLITLFTTNKGWLDIAAYLLGPNLNTMPSLVAPKFAGTAAYAIGQSWTGVVYDGNHTLGVTAVYTAIFLIVAFVLIARRDVKE
jgi:ABC-2 type transport system permease protein